MKKALAILLCAVVMLGACAFTGSPAADHGHYLTDVILTVDDQVIDMSAVTVGVDVYGGDDPYAILLHVEYEGETVGEIGVTKVDGLYILHLASQTVGHKDYAVDPVIELTKDLNDVRDGLVEMLQGIDTTSVAEGIVGMFEDAGKQPETVEEPAAEVEPEEVPEEELPQDMPMMEIDLSELGLNGDPMEVLMDCFQVETVTMGGSHKNLDDSETEIPEGEYSKMSFTASMEDVLKLLSMVTISGDPLLSLEDVPEEAMDAFTVDAASYQGLDDVNCDFGYLNAFVENGDDDSVLGIGYMSTGDEDENSTEAVVGVGSGDSFTTVSFTVSKGAPQGNAFGPDTIDMDNLINLSEMEDREEALATLVEELRTVFAEMVSGAATPILDVMAEEMDAAGVEAPQE